jgi:hypothetical protein
MGARRVNLRKERDQIALDQLFDKTKPVPSLPSPTTNAQRPEQHEHQECRGAVVDAERPKRTLGHSAIACF